MGTQVGWWAGVREATDAHHNAMFARYGMSDLAAYRFRVADDFRSVCIVPCPKEPDVCDEYAANGVWTLAEILATDPAGHAESTQELIRHVSALMFDAICEARGSRLFSTNAKMQQE